MAAVIAFISSAMPFGALKITNGPVVFEYGGDDYCVIWETSKKGSGCVKYSVDGEEKTVWDEEYGVIRTHDVIHRVFVPKDELRGNEYRICSQFVWFKYGYAALKGKTTESEPIAFGGAAPDDGLKLLCVSDIHECEDRFFEAVGKLDYTPDMVLMIGDVTSNTEDVSRFTGRLINDMARLTGGAVPVAYARGNHETRGEFATQYARYLPRSTDGLYFTFNFGPLSAAVLDTGEDKADDHEEYDGLVNFTDYLNKEYDWIQTLEEEDFPGRYRIVFTHIPGLTNMRGMDWATPFDEMGFDMIVGAHYHDAGSWNEDRIPIIVDGGERDDDFWITSIFLNDGVIDLNVTDMAGQSVFSFTTDVGEEG